MNLMDQVSGMQGPQEEAQEPVDNEKEEAAEGSGEPFTAELAKQMQDKLAASIPPEKQQAYQKAALAAKKILYSDETRDMVLQAIQQDAPMDQKLGHNAAGLVLILDKESKHTLPQDIMVPVGVSVVLEGAEMALAMGADITSQDVRDGIDTMIALLMMKFGAKEQEVMQAIPGAGQEPQQPQQPTQPQPGAMA